GHSHKLPNQQGETAPVPPQANQEVHSVTPPILKSFYTAVIESILTGSITAWYGNCTGQDQKALQQVMHLAERTIRFSLPVLQDIYSRRCMTRALSIKKDSIHPGHKLFRLLRSGKHLFSNKTRTETLKRSFYPHTIRTATHDGPSTHLLPFLFSSTHLTHTSLSLSLSLSLSHLRSHSLHTHTQGQSSKAAFALCTVLLFCTYLSILVHTFSCWLYTSNSQFLNFALVLSLSLFLCCFYLIIYIYIYIYIYILFYFFFLLRSTIGEHTRKSVLLLLYGCT
ncbi:hypothetical protein LDENG_00276540, partial [Lucifuga dentata]